MPISYDTNAAITAVLNDLLTNSKYNEFNSLRENDISFKVVSKSKLTKDDELVSAGGHPAECKKISDLHRVFIDAHYILVVDEYQWREADVTRQKAIIHRALMAIKAEVNTSGEVKLGTRKPDVAEFIATISRFGATTPEMESVAQSLQSTAERITGTILAATANLRDEVGVPEEDETEETVKKRFVKPKKKSKPADEEERATLPPPKKKRKEVEDDEPPSSLGDDEDDDEDKLRTRMPKPRTTPLVRSED